MTMDAEKLHALACAYARAPSPDALDAALMEALPLCALIARRFAGRGAEYEDLYQALSLSCVAALKSFDPERGFRFSSYVTPTLTGAARNYVRDKAALLRTPRMARQQAADLQKARDAYILAHHAEPSARELAQALGWEVSRVLSALAVQVALHPVSLDEGGDAGGGLADNLPFQEPGFERFEMREDLRAALAGLTETERTLLSLRFEQKLSQRDTAERMNKTQMQISRMERRVLAALRKEMEL